MQTNRYAVIGAATLFLAACSSKVPDDGFKALRYGMTLPELAALGFHCPPEGFACSRASRNDDDIERFLGKKSYVSVTTMSGRLVAVRIKPELSEAEVIEQLTDEFGAPESFDYAAYGGMATKLYWLSSDNTSIEITKAKQSSGSGPTYVAYNGPDITKDLLSLNKDNKLNSKDY